MTAYNINNVSRLMNEDAAKFDQATGKFVKSEENLLPGGHNSPSLDRTNAQPTRFERGENGKTKKIMGSGKGKEKAKGNPFAKKDGKKGNPFADKGGKKENPFAKKDGKKANPFAKKGPVEESIDRLLYLLEALDQDGLSVADQDEILKRANALPPKYTGSASPEVLASRDRVKALVAKSKAARGDVPHPRWDDKMDKTTKTNSVSNNKV